MGGLQFLEFWESKFTHLQVTTVEKNKTSLLPNYSSWQTVASSFCNCVKVWCFNAANEVLLQKPIWDVLVLQAGRARGPVFEVPPSEMVVTSGHVQSIEIVFELVATGEGCEIVLTVQGVARSRLWSFREQRALQPGVYREAAWDCPLGPGLQVRGGGGGGSRAVPTLPR